MERCTICGCDGYLAKLFPVPGLRLALCEYDLALWYERARPGRPAREVLAEVQATRRPAANALTHLVVRQ